MSKWISESSGLESKNQLKAHREHYYSIRAAALQLGVVPTKWTAVEIASQAALWAEADAHYEGLKAALKTRLAALAPAEQAVYFAEIGEQPQDINVWLAPSPVV